MWRRIAEWRGSAAALAATAVLASQSPVPDLVLDVAFAAGPQRGRLPALAWLADSWLPATVSWPRSVDPRGSFRLTLAAGEVRIAPLAIPLADDIAIAGSCTIGGVPPALFRCAIDGTEDWFVPPAWPLPPAWRSVLQQLDLLALERPRTLATNVVVGHFAGALSDGDPHSDLLQLGASLCGDVTWMAWPTPSWLRVRGRSEGGLVLPAALLLLARGSGKTADGLSVRAYAARDEDRAEAARQMFRVGGDAMRSPLRAMLHADDPTRLSAIDTLVRTHSGDDLPAIVAAASPDMPWATLAAVDAVHALWPSASPLARQRTRAAIARADSLALRAIDLDSLAQRTGPAPGLEPASARARALIWLAVVALGLTIAWARERARTTVP